MLHSGCFKTSPLGVGADSGFVPDGPGLLAGQAPLAFLW